jgi:Skp family chaperone for outer membrane proteins
MNTNSPLTSITIATILFASVITTVVIGGDDPKKSGPFDSITLAGKKDLTLKNVDDHISWGDEKANTVWSIGFMETGKALSQMLQADHFLDARNELDEELKEQISDARELMESLQEEGQTLDPESPEVPSFRQRWESAYGEFQKMQQLVAEARATLMAEQMQEAYNEILEAVNVVSQRMSIDMVLRFIPPDGEFEQTTPDATIMQIRLRTALRLPEGIDITDDVLSELGLVAQ